MTPATSTCPAVRSQVNRARYTAETSPARDRSNSRLTLGYWREAAQRVHGVNRRSKLADF
jgi:hypothetical protein